MEKARAGEPDLGSGARAAWKKAGSPALEKAIQLNRLFILIIYLITYLIYLKSKKS